MICIWPMWCISIWRRTAYAYRICLMTLWISDVIDIFEHLSLCCFLIWNWHHLMSLECCIITFWYSLLRFYNFFGVWNKILVFASITTSTAITVIHELILGWIYTIPRNNFLHGHSWFSHNLWIPPIIPNPSCSI